MKCVSFCNYLKIIFLRNNINLSKIIQNIINVQEMALMVIFYFIFIFSNSCFYIVSPAIPRDGIKCKISNLLSLLKIKKLCKKKIECNEKNIKNYEKKEK